MHRNALMVCYYFPPLQTVGTLRSEGFCKCLPDSGWIPTVLTVDKSQDPWMLHGSPVPDLPIVRCREIDLTSWIDGAHASLSRIGRCLGLVPSRNYFREYLALPDPHISWNIRREGMQLLAKSDLLFVTCSPFSAALKGLELKRLTGKPLVVDFRDPWSMNPYVRRSPFAQKRIETMEQMVVEQTDALILNTPGTLELYQNRYPESAGKFFCIPNGYDVLNPVSDYIRSPFKIIHTGTLYAKRNPELLFEALSEIDAPDIEFIHAGVVSEEITPCDGRVNIRQLGPVSGKEAHELMKGGSLLFLIQGWEGGVSDYVSVAAKTYEYLATGLPILYYGPEGDNTRILRQYGGQTYLVTEPSLEKMKNAIKTAYQRRNETQPVLRPEFVTEFDRHHLTQKLASVFDSVCS